MIIGKKSALYYTERQNDLDEKVEVICFIKNREWDIPKLQGIIFQEMVDYIRECIKPPREGQNDTPWWMGSTHRRFTIKSAWHLLGRNRKKEVSICICGPKNYLERLGFSFGKCGEEDVGGSTQY